MTVPSKLTSPLGWQVLKIKVGTNKRAILQYLADFLLNEWSSLEYLTRMVTFKVCFRPDDRRGDDLSPLYFTFFRAFLLKLEARVF